MLGLNDKSAPAILEASANDSSEALMHSKGGTRQDAIEMARIGKVQELHRRFNFIPILGLVAGLMATWEAVQATSSFALTDGGRAGLVWGFLGVSIGFGFAVFSMAEMASMAPTTGGQYHWVSEFAPPGAQKFLSYITGWLCVMGWQTGTTSAMFIVGQLIQGLVVLNNPGYIPERWHLTLLVIAIAVFSGIFNTVLAKRLPVVETIVLIIHFGGFFGYLIALWVCSSGNRATASQVFTTFENAGGWPSQGLATLVGTTGALYSLIGPDSAVHMAEEVKDASRTIPQAMTWAVICNAIMGFIMAITYAFCIPSVEEILTSPTGFPMVAVYYNVAGSVAGATAMTVVIMILFLCGPIGCTATASRQLYAFARDRGLPFNNFFCRVNPASEIPLNAIIATVIVTTLLSLINIGSLVAFNAITSLSMSAFCTSYVISISCVLIRRLSGRPFPPKRWSLGKFGLPCNILGIAYVSLGFLFSLFPLGTPVTSETMNWGIVMYSGVVLIGLTYYVFWARKIYVGPVVQIKGIACES